MDRPEQRMNSRVGWKMWHFIRKDSDLRIYIKDMPVKKAFSKNCCIFSHCMCKKIKLIKSR